MSFEVCVCHAPPLPCNCGRHPNTPNFHLHNSGLNKQAEKAYLRDMATNMAVSTTSAASRAFAIPEMLEHILKFVANDGKYTERDFRTPAVELFALRRVSQDFDNTIVGSKALQWRMHEAPISWDWKNCQTFSIGWCSDQEVTHPAILKIRGAILRAEKRGKKQESWVNIGYWPSGATHMGWIWWKDEPINIDVEEGTTFGDVFDIVKRKDQAFARRSWKP